MFICPQCGNELDDNDLFCCHCGTIVKKPEVEMPAENTTEKEASKEAKKHKMLPKKLIAGIVAGVALVVAATIILVTLFAAPKPNYALYIKDGELFYMDIDDREPIEITKNLYDGDAMLFTDSSYAILSDDGDTIFYIDKMKNTANYSLYYRSVSDTEQEPVKIDSYISRYYINRDADCITYIKDYDNGCGDLYRHNLESRDKIASEVTYFSVSSDGKSIVYLDTDNDLYIKYDGEDRQKTDSEIDRVFYVNQDFDTVYYTKDGSLYKNIIGEEKIRIASDVGDKMQFYESGEIYYVKSQVEDVPLINYVEDNMKEKDAAMKEPAVDAGEEKWSEYLEKESRDRLRENLNEKTVKIYNNILCYYDGKKETVITEEYNNFAAISEDAPVAVFNKYEREEIEKVKITDIEYATDVRNMVDATLYPETKSYIAIKGKMFEIVQDKPTEFRITSDGKAIYFLDNVENKYDDEDKYLGRAGNAYRIDIAENKPHKQELYDKNVFEEYVGLSEDNRYFYFKEIDKLNGTLYVDKQKIDTNVLMFYFKIQENGNVLYMKDWDTEKERGTLKLYDGKAREIADEVYSYELTPDGEVVYLRDYSLERVKGDLYIYDGESECIDYDVSAILPVMSIDKESDGVFSGVYYRQ